MKYRPLVSDYYFSLEPVSGRLSFCMQQNNIQHIPSLNGTEYSKYINKIFQLLHKISKFYSNCQDYTRCIKKTEQI